jgi:hypothetical protein
MRGWGNTSDLLREALLQLRHSLEKRHDVSLANSLSCHVTLKSLALPHSLFYLYVAQIPGSEFQVHVGSTLSMQWHDGFRYLEKS